MKRYSLLWFICIVLKFFAVFIIVEAIFNLRRQFLSGVFMSGEDIITSFLGFPFTISRDVYSVWAVISRILDGLAKAGLLWASAEAIRIILNTEAYARGTYNLLRQRADRQRQVSDQATRIRTQRPVIADEDIVPFEAPKPRRKRRFGEGSGYTDAPTIRRGSGKFVDRPDSSVRPPRPSGHVEVVQSLDQPSEGDGLPFDKV